MDAERRDLERRAKQGDLDAARKLMRMNARVRTPGSWPVRLHVSQYPDVRAARAQGRSYIGAQRHQQGAQARWPALNNRIFGRARRVRQV